MPAQKHHRRFSRKRQSAPILREAEKVTIDSLEERLYGTPLPDKNKPTQPISPGAIDAKRFMEKARLAFEESQQEKNVPDLKTELKKIINQTEEKTTMPNSHPNITNNVTRATFDYIRDNPGLTRNTITATLIAKGYNPKSVTSLIGQMTRQRLIRVEGGKFFANQQEYTPIKRKFPPLTKRVVKTKSAPRPKWTPPEVPAMPPVISAPAEWSVESVIGSLNVRQAMAVYDELRKIFGA